MAHNLRVDDVGIVIQAAWLRLVAGAGYPVLAGPGGSFAVRTGIGSNTENGAVLTPEALDDPAALDALLAHVAGVPASAVLTSPAYPDHVIALTDRGWRPERSAHEMVGRLVVPGGDAPPGVEVREVLDEVGLVAHTDVFVGDGWFDEPADRDGSLELARRLGPDHGVRRWVALDGGEPVGAATSVLVAGTDVVALDELCVLSLHRRRRIGTALTRARLGRPRRTVLGGCTSRRRRTAPRCTARSG